MVELIIQIIMWYVLLIVLRFTVLVCTTNKLDKREKFTYEEIDRFDDLFVINFLFNPRWLTVWTSSQISNMLRGERKRE